MLLCVNIIGTETSLAKCYFDVSVVSVKNDRFPFLKRKLSNQEEISFRQLHNSWFGKSLANNFNVYFDTIPSLSKP